MKIEEQVTNLEFSKKLKELGVKQESLFYWKTYRPDQFDKAPHPKIINFKEEPGFSENSVYSAFTAGEIILPQNYQIWWNQNAWGPIHGDQYLPGFYAEKTWIYKGLKRNQEADARALMLIYLLENSLVEIPNRSPEKLAA